MFHHTNVIDIDRPVAEVFEYMVQCRNIPQWVNTIEDDWQEIEGPAGLGTRVTEVVNLGLRRAEVTWEITAFEQNKLFTWQAESWIGSTRVSYSFDKTVTGTRVTGVLTSQPKGLVRLVSPILGYLSPRQRQKHLTMVKKF